MATRQYIAPLPDNIDRDAFGHWISGFTDGEGCFLLQQHSHAKRSHGHPVAEFKISLRLDDIAILKSMQSYFRCGIIAKPVCPRNPQTNKKPSVEWHTAKTADLYNIIVPHFKKYPLRAKKRRDFLIWKQGVEFLYSMSLLNDNGRGIKCGVSYIWTPERLAHFSQLIIALKAQREFDSSIVEAPCAIVEKRDLSLFDDIP